MNITKMSHEHTKDAIRTQQLKPKLPVIIFTRHASKYWLRVKVTCLAGWVYSSTAALVLFCSFCCVWDWDFCLTPSLWTGPLAAPWWWWSQVCQSCTTWIPIRLLPPFLCGKGIAFVVHESVSSPHHHSRLSLSTFFLWTGLPVNLHQHRLQLVCLYCLPPITYWMKCCSVYLINMVHCALGVCVCVCVCVCVHVCALRIVSIYKILHFTNIL